MYIYIYVYIYFFILLYIFYFSLIPFEVFSNYFFVNL